LHSYSAGPSSLSMSTAPEAFKIETNVSPLQNELKMPHVPAEILAPEGITTAHVPLSAAAESKKSHLWTSGGFGDGGSGGGGGDGGNGGGASCDVVHSTVPPHDVFPKQLSRMVSVSAKSPVFAYSRYEQTPTHESSAPSSLSRIRLFEESKSSKNVSPVQAAPGFTHVPAVNRVPGSTVTTHVPSWAYGAHAYCA